jgi:hypothetical protein
MYIDAILHRHSRVCVWALSMALIGAPVPPQVPANLKVPDTEIVLLKALGKGKQIYRCAASANAPGRFEWVLEKPQATLFNDRGDRIGTHFEGPTWLATDGSKVVGQVMQRADAPQSGAIPWLMLKAKATGGAGTFAQVTYVQRVATRGGVAPAGGCDSAHAGSESSVDYQADYYFYVPRARR